MSDPLVVSLADPRAAEPALTGGKAATLARLRTADFPVPDGFVVTTAAYRAHADAAGASDRLAALERGEERAASALRDRLAGTPLPERVLGSIRDRLDDGAYAVRSSATAEDLAEASFAGQHDTELGVDAADVPDAVARCLGSLFTDRAVAYRERNGVPHRGVAMAVVVQRMVEPDTSGILFTADPVTGRRDVAVVDAGPGRGERQVSGRETADTARIDRETGEVLDYRVGSGRAARVLDDDTLRTLADLGDRIEAELGGPQDVEWAIRDGDVSVLQSRPVTSLFPVPDPRPADDALHVYYSFGHRQGMTAAMPPLSLGFWRDLTNELGRQYGLPGRLGAVAGGRLYLDLTPYVARPWLADRIVSNLRIIDEPTAAALADLLAERGGDLPDPATGPRAWLRAAGSAGRFARTLVAFVAGFPGALAARNPEDAPDDLLARYEEEVAESVAAVRSHDSARQRVRAARDAVFESVDWLLEPFYGRFLAGVAAGWALRRLVPERADDVAELAGGFEGDVTARMGLALGDVADAARDHPAVADALRDGATLDDLSGVPGGDAFRAAFADFLDEYGFRGPGEIDPSRPRYRDDPSLLLGVVAARLDAGERGAHRDRFAARQADAAAARDRLEAAAHPLLRPVVRRLCRLYRHYVGLREHPKFALSKLLAEFRTQVLAAGDELVSRGVLADREDAWLLTLSELDAALADGATPGDLPARRRDHERFAATDAPRVVTSDGEVPTARVEPTEDASDLTGTGVSPGVVEGVVRVVTDPRNADLRPGEVLVAPYTDPGWTPLFLNAGALVTEVGGRLTHGSLVAREYGIPAVVAVDGATRRLRTGDRVRVDGANGVVERIE
ncbi:PEP/pyruvate-binding domain-containing protein [Halobacterium litoreum]|uniref:PEP/pyruvate-binding domain-containing protein n=1 Tax=Halobacterium litoreum TaxID=2039234 RepID=A0ABD5NFD0_9EURY|nr:PEP/pyruvate-binding domain-containing protein [Halobacterium litoreum]UHH13212.1 pyruvate, phosphate dikinase [Halobacterium litoreum]